MSTVGNRIDNERGLIFHIIHGSFVDGHGIRTTVFLKEPPLQPVKLVPDAQTVEAGNWLKLIHHSSVIAIFGGRGKGKSALGYRLLEYLRWTASPYVVGLPGNASRILPDWLGMVASLEDVPPKAIVLVNESYMPYYARSSMASDARAMPH